MDAIAAYERGLSAALLDVVQSIDGAVVHGVTDRRQLADRVPTVSFTIEGIESSRIAAELAAQGVGARSGHMYAPRLMQRLPHARRNGPGCRSSTTTRWPRLRGFATC